MKYLTIHSPHCSRRGGCRKAAAMCSPAILTVRRRPEGRGAAPTPRGAAGGRKAAATRSPALPPRCSRHGERHRAPRSTAAAGRWQLCSLSSQHGDGQKAAAARYPALLMARRQRKAAATRQLLCSCSSRHGGGQKAAAYSIRRAISDFQWLRQTSIVSDETLRSPFNLGNPQFNRLIVSQFLDFCQLLRSNFFILTAIFENANE